MTTEDIAKDLVALCQAGKFDDAGEKYWAEDVLSVEPAGDMAELRGKAAVRAKGAWWFGVHEVHGAEVAGPYISGDSFVVRFTIDQTVKATGERMTLDEVGVYTVKDGKIAEERFFYAG
ncbi:MAG: nuclear transport factor 2 family protein [Phenylobacterium sp.]